VVTGHSDGVITIDLAESDDVRREQRRAELGEPYRTMLGHFRHEIAHYYWTLLVERRGPAELAAWRALFGDERADYGAAQERHYENGPPAAWAARHVSAYATMHPWEDWAETFAHYLHIRDTMQTAAAFALTVAGPATVADPALASVPAAGAGVSIDRGADRVLAAADLRAERRQPKHGTRGPVSVHARSGGDRAARLRPRRRYASAGASGSAATAALKSCSENTGSSSLPAR
jgi:hypothetical protein